MGVRRRSDDSGRGRQRSGQLSGGWSGRLRCASSGRSGSDGVRFWQRLAWSGQPLDGVVNIGRLLWGSAGNSSRCWQGSGQLLQGSLGGQGDSGGDGRDQDYSGRCRRVRAIHADVGQRLGRLGRGPWDSGRGPWGSERLGRGTGRLSGLWPQVRATQAEVTAVRATLVGFDRVQGD